MRQVVCVSLVSRVLALIFARAYLSVLYCSVLLFLTELHAPSGVHKTCVCDIAVCRTSVCSSKGCCMRQVVSFFWFVTSGFSYHARQMTRATVMHVK